MITVLSSDDGVQLEDISNLISKKIQTNSYVIVRIRKSLKASECQREEV